MPLHLFLLVFVNLGQVGAVDFVAGALRDFPDEDTLEVTCTSAMASLILFNRVNGVRAGKLGALNASLAFYGSHLDNPDIVSSMGYIGTYFDFCMENRLIARELGAIEMFIQNIRNNFHGPYSEWAYELVKQSLYAMSSGTWNNADIAYQQGFIPLAVSLMAEHGSDAKIAEESLQALKAMVYASDFLRSRLSDQGLFEALVGVLRTRATDKAAVSLVCESTMHVIGSTVMLDTSSTPRAIPFNASIQQRAAEVMLEAGLFLRFFFVFGYGGFRPQENRAFTFGFFAQHTAQRCF